ncbi:hypothetical protein V5799_008014 [Amblyomma americanum]|uniref:Anaphylatoxin-like domain-containing protein n=1 Tax=Amblyomma americanum TaxID=6943 RepID=A0AAQ4FEB5_AMBAM
MKSSAIRRRGALQDLSNLIGVLCLLLSLAEGCIVTAPSLVRLGTQETILVRNTRKAPNNVTLQATDHPAEARLLFKESFVLASGGVKLVHMRLDESKFSAEDFQTNHSKYVSLRVQCDGRRRFDERAILLLSPRSGYLFLQTDKPMYRPTETVRIRVLAVDEMLLPSNDSLLLEIKNPQGIVSEAKNLWSSSASRSSGIFSHHYALSQYAMFGEWTITVTYGQHKSHKTKLSFHVKDYVLPTFGVRIYAPKVLLPNAKDYQLAVDARYVYGKPVKGTVTIRVYVRNEANHDVQFGLKNVQTLTDGKAFWNLPVSELKNGSRWQDWVNGNRLSVRVAVVEEATAKQEAAVDSSVVFSNSFYSVGFEHTRRDYRPLTRVVVVADISKANGHPASNVDTRITAISDDGSEVTIYRERAKSNQDGKAFFELTAKKSARRINVTVSTSKRDAHDTEARASTVLSRYESPADAFVFITQDTSQTTYHKDDHFHKYIVVSPDDMDMVYYQVTNRGKILAYGIAEGNTSSHRQIAFLLTEQMSPKFRLLVFAFHKGHLVADSQDYTMDEECSAGSNITVETDLNGKEPGAQGKIIIKGEPDTAVGLLAVDKAVYLLSDAGLLTRKKLFRKLRSHDLSCGPGGGITSDEVFADAGVVLISAKHGSKVTMTETSCAARIQRRRRDLRNAESQFKDPFLQLCCHVGTLRDRLGRHCSTREEIIRRHFNNPKGDSCAYAFAQCCARGFAGPTMTDLHRARGPYDPSTQLPDNELDEPDFSGLQLRRDFMETWLFNEGTIGPDSEYIHEASAPHSVTTWSIQAVSVSSKGGICVTKPVEAMIFRKMFLQVSLPATVVRNEQVEVVATLFSYDAKVQATVSLHGLPGLCIGSKHPQLPDRKQLEVDSNNAKSVSFPVVPLRQGKFPIKIDVRSSGGSDLVQKTLVVVPEGMPFEETFSVRLDPSNEQRRKTRAVLKRGCRDILDEENRRQVISIIPWYPPDTVPHTESCSVSIIGSETSMLTEAVISNVDSLISMPMGCGEQNMMIMAPVLYAYNYLKMKNMLNETLFNTALTYLRKGYQQELSFRNDNGSFSTFQNGPGNVWLTAFVLRVFCEARNVIDISPEVIESGLWWLTTKQQANGTFEERDPILHRELLQKLL